jgi:nucleotide-binding universal stress UspA family protein
MYEKILVPLDGSKVAEAALPNVADLAMRMAPKTRIEVTLLQVISNLTYNVLTPEELAQVPYSEEELKQIKLKSLDYLEKVAETLRTKRIDVKTVVTVGHAADEIVKVSQAIGANVIAMSTHGYSGVKRWALGSVADKVLHISDIPVLLIRVK